MNETIDTCRRCQSPLPEGRGFTRKQMTESLEDGTVVFLLDDDSHHFTTSLGEVLDDVEADGREGYYEGKLRRITNDRFIRNVDESVLDNILARAEDLVADECIDDFMSTVEQPEAKSELKGLLAKWADKRMTMPIYEVKNVTWVDYDPEADE